MLCKTCNNYSIPPAPGCDLKNPIPINHVAIVYLGAQQKGKICISGTKTEYTQIEQEQNLEQLLEDLE